MTENEIAQHVVDAAYHVHKRLGPGLLESVYEVVLAYELKKRGLKPVRQLAIPIAYDSLTFDEGFRADIMVDGKVVLELKSLESVAKVHKKQLLTYLRLADKRLGLLINFGRNSFATEFRESSMGWTRNRSLREEGREGSRQGASAKKRAEKGERSEEHLSAVFFAP